MITREQIDKLRDKAISCSFKSMDAISAAIRIIEKHGKDNPLLEKEDESWGGTIEDWLYATEENVYGTYHAIEKIRDEALKILSLLDSVSEIKSLCAKISGDVDSWKDKVWYADEKGEEDEVGE